MPLIRLDWHFNCWRPILNLQNINLLGAGELKCYICHFLWLGIPLPQPQGQLHPTGEGWIHQIAECFLLKAHSFFRSSKEALSISHGIANTPTTSPDHLCAAHTLVFLLFFGTSVLFCFFFSLQDKFILVSATLRTCKQASKEKLQVFLCTQQCPFPWPCPFEPHIMAVWDSSSSESFFSISWSISLHWHASQQNLSGNLPASRAEFIHV